MWIDPSIWPSHSAGLTARPTSCAATILATRPALVEDAHLRRVAERRVGLHLRRRLPERRRVVHQHVGGVDAPDQVGRADGRASRSARSFAAALVTARPPNSVAREPVVWPHASA